jgi:hypothetical protein
MDRKEHECPDCAGEMNLDRRRFLQSAGLAAAAAAGVLPLGAVPRIEAAPTPESEAEKAIKGLYETLTDKQKKEICFDWDHKDSRGLLRTHVSNNWQITKPHVKGDFFEPKQFDIIYDIFKSVHNPDWHKKVMKHLKDDTGGKEWGAEQSIALFGEPGKGKFMFVMTGRHMTIRADGGNTENMAFGGPIFYGHAAEGFNEKKDHPGNVYWPQALMANDIYKMLDDKKKEKALIAKAPPEARVDFKGAKGTFSGIPCTELSADEKKKLEAVLTALVEPFRKEDRDEALECLKKQGGLDKCWLTFYKEGDIGNDGVWDNWRLEGPTFVWYFRGAPHVHVWVNVGDNESVKLNSRG